MGRCAWGVLEREELCSQVRLDEARRVDVQRVGAQQMVGRAKASAPQDVQNALVAFVHQRVHGDRDLVIGAVARVAGARKRASAASSAT
eukprot:6341791-Pyramimonas_sp.AAC.1